MFLFGPPNVEQLKARHDVAGLIKALGYPKDERVRQNAAEALGTLGDPRAVEPLLAALRNDREAMSMRSTAACALAKLGDPRVVEPLMAIFNDAQLAEKPAVRAAVAEALGDLGAVQAIDVLGSVFEGREYVSVLVAAAAALGKIGGARVVTPLIAGLDYGDEVRKVVAESLGKIGTPAVEPLLAVLKERKRDEVRATIARILGNIGDTRAVEPLISLLEEKDKQVRLAAAEALGKLGDARAVEPLAARVKAQGSEERYIRAAAIEALGKIGDPRAAEILIAILGEEFAGDLHEKAAQGLIKIGDIRAVEPLIPLLQSHLYWVRRRALEALTAIAARDAAAQQLLETRGMELSAQMQASNKEAADFARALAQIQVGLSQDTLFELVGRPDFSMDLGTALGAFGTGGGVGGPKSLNYNTQFGQFQVHVNHGVVEKVLWVEGLLQRLKEIA